MSKVRITKQFNFEMAHALYNYDGACKNIHGHSYVLEITLKGEIKKCGFVIDFKELKFIVNKEIIDVSPYISYLSLSLCTRCQFFLLNKIIFVHFVQR